MTRRTRIAALFAAVGLLSMATSAAIAVPSTYSISVSKTASPTAVPSSGGTVDFTVWVTATGTGFFQTVVVSDTMAGCTVAGPFGDAGSDGKLSPGETWSYTCTVANVHPGDSNTANVNACHSVASCAAVHDATGSGSVTLDQGPDVSSAPATEAPPTEAPPTEAPPTEAPPTEAPPTEAPPTEAPPTEAVPTVNPSAAVGDATDAPGATQAATDMTGIVAGPHGADIKSMFMLIAVLCFLIASIIVMTPAAPKAEALGGK
jgi:hypothetical protein